MALGAIGKLLPVAKSLLSDGLPNLKNVISDTGLGCGKVPGGFNISKILGIGDEGAADNIPEVTLPKDRWNEAARHADDAMKNGHTDTYTIDRPGASARRIESLKDYPTKPGFDRDEWPPAVFKEGGEGASVRYISPSDNRGLGAYLRNQIAPYENGTKVKIKIK